MRNTTTNMIKLLPSWMKIRQRPEESQGGAFLDTVGAQTQDVFDLLEAVLIMKHPANSPYLQNVDGDYLLKVQGIDLLNIDFVYRIKLPPAIADQGSFVIHGDEVNLRRCPSVFDFYKLDAGLKYYYDQTDSYIYLRLKFESVSINGTTFIDLEEYNVWGPYDEVGLLLGCPRLPLERNTDYRLRLLDVFKNPGNATRTGLLNYIARSLGLTTDQVELYEFSDEYVDELYTSTISDELWEFFELSNKVNSVAGSSYWDVIDNYNKGIRYLPIYWGDTLEAWNQIEIQNGIGYDDDLLISAPEQIDTIQDFEYDIGVQGIRLVPNHKYPDIRFKYKVRSQGHLYGEGGIKPENYGFTVLSSKELPAEVTIQAEKKYPGKNRLPMNIGISPDPLNWTITSPPLPGSPPVENGYVKTIELNPYSSGYDIGSDNWPAGEAINPQDTHKETGDYTWLQVFAHLNNKGMELDHLKAVDVAYTNMSDAPRHVIFTNEDYGDDGYLVDGAITYVNMQRTITEATIVTKKWEDNINYVDGENVGLEVSPLGHLKYFTYKNDWLDNDNGETMGIEYLNNGAITIHS